MVPRACSGGRSPPIAEKDRKDAREGFANCLKIMPGDGPSKVFLGRIAKFCTTAPNPDWDCVWPLVEK